MGLYKVLGYGLIAVIAVLAYFQMQCWQEEQEKAKMPKTKFNPKETNCHIEYGFAVEHSGIMIEIGINYIFNQFMPCAILKALSHLQGEYLFTFYLHTLTSLIVVQFRIGIQDKVF